MNNIECYTDASYSPQYKICVIGYKIYNSKIFLEKLYNVKNTQAELIAVKRCIEKCKKIYPHQKIIIYTDCQRALKNDYGLNVIIKKLDGHKKGLLKDDRDVIFSSVDKAVRKYLRKEIKESKEFDKFINNFKRDEEYFKKIKEETTPIIEKMFGKKNKNLL